jgi:hypothetical protein
MKNLYKKIKSCRISNDKKLHKLINFGNVALAGIFPKNKNINIPKAPLSIVFSNKSKLLQLEHDYNSNFLFGSNYGYRSGLNKSMISHLKEKYLYLNKKLNLSNKDYILDIGSNDGTFLNFFSNQINKVGCDPSAKKFKKYYNKNIKTYYQIFDQNVITKLKFKFKLVSAIAMFYDLNNPVEFCKNVEKIIDKNGIFHIEIAYLPDIIKEFSFDTFCQEHLTYYSLISFKNLINQTNFKIIDFQRNSINGGSINFDLALNNSNIKPKLNKIKNLYNYELKNNFHKLSKYKIFFKEIDKNINKINKNINLISKKTNKIYGFGASTKGNVTLQLCKLNNKKIRAIYDVNKEKFGSYTPGTNILIKDEKHILKDKPDYLILLIWHFKQTIKQKFVDLKMNKINIISLFPKFRIIKKND